MSTAWKPSAERLATRVTHPGSRWRDPVSSVPRHLLTPRWWTCAEGVWQLVDGSADDHAWMRSAYSDRTLVTRIGPSHADHAAFDDRPTGSPTSSSTMPGLTVRMFQHALIQDGQDVVEIGTGSGYGAALLSHRLGDRYVTSVDVDSYLGKTAQERLGEQGLFPSLLTLDATAELPGHYDRIVATVSVRPIPAAWMKALRTGGRLVTTITDTGLLVTADKHEDGYAYGQVEWDRAAFMATRSGPDYPPSSPDGLLEHAQMAEGDVVSVEQYPVMNVRESWELWSALSITCSGIEHYYGQEGKGGHEVRTAIMLHPDGSWARAKSHGTEPPEVHQGGPRRLWDLLDELRTTWLRDGQLPVYGAQVKISPDGETRLRRGSWAATIRKPDETSPCVLDSWNRPRRKPKIHR